MPLGGEVDVVSKGLVRLLDRSCVDPMQLLNRRTPASCNCMQQQPLHKFSKTWVQGQSAHVACCNHSYCSIHMSLSLCCLAVMQARISSGMLRAKVTRVSLRRSCKLLRLGSGR